MQPLPDERLQDERISAWLDGELSAEEALAFQRDLDRDPALAQAVALLKGVRDDLVRHGPVRAPTGFVSDVFDRIDEAEAVAPSTAWWRRPLGVPVEVFAAAAVALLVLWAAMPTPAPAPHAATAPFPDDAPTATLAGAGAPVVVAAAPGYTLVTSLPADEVRAVVDAVGGTLRDGDPMVIKVPAVGLSPLRAQLRQLGTLTPSARERPVAGDVTFTLTLTAP
ncbi:MAG: hypothetical protein H6733_09190 [Alphaproteobacteria bacterium]|nr:hypothetical protein [Alphaproteobacteria bacterium]